MPRFAPIRRARYRKALAKRRARTVARLDRERKALKEELWQAYIHAPTHTEARRLLTDIWLLA